GRQAATLFVKDIPVLTFIGTEIDSLSNGSDAVSLASSNTSAELQAGAAAPGDILNAGLENDPVLRATNLGAQLDTEAINAEELSVRYHEETEGFIVTLADEDLITLDSRTILADTTEDAAEDALQVTNRLRRLIGDVEPVAEIEGMPEPEPEPVAAAPTPAIAYSSVGGASWYGPGFHGRLTASGEVYNQYDITAAHRTLPFGTRVLVTNLYTGRQVTVRINDRGPYAGNRIIDLSRGAADIIGLTSSGVGTVQLDILY
ncbi:MAG: septal ring lytic transglycosylase RlpA family protein, partial [Cyanobacteria bacterium J06635_11]